MTTSVLFGTDSGGSSYTPTEKSFSSHADTVSNKYPDAEKVPYACGFREYDVSVIKDASDTVKNFTLFQFISIEALSGGK
jgi:hypothetical protein